MGGTCAWLTFEVILLAAQLQLGAHFELLYRVDLSIPDNVHHLHAVLTVPVVADLELCVLSLQLLLVGVAFVEQLSGHHLAARS